MPQVCAIWVAKILIAKMKESRVNNSYALLTGYNHDPEDFHFRSVTCGETLVYHYDPESKQKSVEWKYMRSPQTKSSKRLDLARGPWPLCFGISKI